MKYFFVQDYRQKYRFFSSEPIQNIQVKFTRLEKLWEEAKKRLMLLPKRILAQEQAFARALKLNEDSVEILHSGRLDEKRLKIKFFLFLQKQRTKHILLLVGEAILLPVSGLLALLPGPNVFFWSPGLDHVHTLASPEGDQQDLTKKPALYNLPDAQRMGTGSVVSRKKKLNGHSG